MEQNTNVEQNSTVEENDVYENDVVVDKVSLVRNKAFKGSVPYDVIVERIGEQFSNYIDMPDDTNYVETFYNQWDRSVPEAEDDDYRDALDNMYDEFNAMLVNLFETKLGISVAEYGDIQLADDDLRYIICRTYEYFIINARRNFKAVYAQYINGIISTMGVADEHYFEQVQNLIDVIGPSITVVSPVEFINFTGDTEIMTLFNDTRIVGNFLLKYSPKLYQNEEYLVELINYITNHRDFGTELAKISGGYTDPEDENTIEVPVQTFDQPNKNGRMYDGNAVMESIINADHGQSIIESSSDDNEVDEIDEEGGEN